MGWVRGRQAWLFVAGGVVASAWGAGASSEPSPTVFTRVSFDVRDLPHRGPHDVDPGLVTRRVELLAQRVRDAAGDPSPRILIHPGTSAFRVEFFGPASAARAQCQRAVDAVASPAAADAPDAPHVARREVLATPCAPIEGGSTP